jgi:rod shape-determining protein MreC
MDRKKILKLTAVVLIFFVVLSIIGMLTAREKNSLNFLERGVRIVSYPFQILFNAASEKTQLLFMDISELAELREENISLRKEMSMSRYEIDILKKDRQENKRLRELLSYKEKTDEYFELALGRVIGQSNTNWNRSMFIDLGSEDGINKDMVVINHQGLVGKIINVAPKSSEVLLILDSDSGVGGRLVQNRKTIGVIQGQGIDQKNLSFVHLPKEMEINPGDEVITSGLDDFYPPELNLGIVSEVVETQRGFTKTAVIATSVDFESLEEVFVIKNFYKEKFVTNLETEEEEKE